MRELLPVAERLSGYPIRLAPAPADSEEGVCGLWIRMEGVDYVFVHEDTSRAHQDHIVAHEMGHILRNHRGSPILSQSKPVTDRLVPTLDPAVVKMMLGRTSYEHQDEKEAELIGTYLQRHVHRPGARISGHDRVAETLLRGRR
ncbi:MULTISPECIES: hypothetical protein [unclassified Streptomyces]|uniref:hypothetical protein n=1 Tax=unclassified Streptomyces TaxID=2593676 RepID=UPI002DDA1FC2|nr:hypothetical protein [Streptomyces sp. NBC_01750]WSB02288.1 hypothetical protein OIE54_25175 [Streptomyces sp. NBC_01794]WSD33461.1 hypothetical protein OG966_17055 [Streptomyces sp. NBC_01750]